jgi:hypothetical protein
MSCRRRGCPWTLEKTCEEVVGEEGMREVAGAQAQESLSRVSGFRIRRGEESVFSGNRRIEMQLSTLFFSPQGPGYGPSQKWRLSEPAPEVDPRISQPGAFGRL